MFEICQHNAGSLRWLFMHAFLINLNFYSFIKSAAQITKGNKRIGGGGGAVGIRGVEGMLGVVNAAEHKTLRLESLMFLASVCVLTCQSVQLLFFPSSSFFFFNLHPSHTLLRLRQTSSHAATHHLSLQAAARHCMQKYHGEVIGIVPRPSSTPTTTTITTPVLKVQTIMF